MTKQERLPEEPEVYEPVKPILSLKPIDHYQQRARRMRLVWDWLPFLILLMVTILIISTIYFLTRGGRVG